MRIPCQCPLDLPPSLPPFPLLLLALALKQSQTIIDKGRAVQGSFVVSPEGSDTVLPLVRDGVDDELGALQVLLGRGGREGGREGGRVDEF